MVEKVYRPGGLFEENGLPRKDDIWGRGAVEG
jgi:hypothetical protein